MMKTKSEVKRFGQFAAVGIANTLIDLIFFNIFLYFKINPTVASGLSFLIANFNGYLMNRAWTFSDRKAERALPQYGLYLVTNLVGLLINIAVLHYGVRYLPVPPILAANIGKLIAIGLTVLWNYSTSRLWVFRQPAS